MPETPEGNRPLFQTLALVGNLGFQIAVPLIILAIVGRLLDQKLDSSPWFLLGGIFLSIFLSTLLVVRSILPLLNPPDHSSHSVPSDGKSDREKN